MARCRCALAPHAPVVVGLDLTRTSTRKNIIKALEAVQVSCIGALAAPPRVRAHIRSTLSCCLSVVAASAPTVALCSWFGQ